MPKGILVAGLILFALTNFFLFVACGGSSSASTTTPSPVSIAILPAAASLNINQQQRFNDRISGGSGNSAVTWPVQENTGRTVTSPGPHRCRGRFAGTPLAGDHHMVCAPAPTITSTPPQTGGGAGGGSVATEGQVYSYTLQATDTAGGTVSFALTSGPVGASISNSPSPTMCCSPSATGALAKSVNAAAATSTATLTWTPTHQQARTANAFTVTATTSEGGRATQSWSVTPSGTIRGSAGTTYVDISSGQATTVPVDLSSSTVQALVPNGNGGSTVYPGQGTASGTFTIPNVPAGTYYLQAWNRYDQVQTSDPWLGTVMTGRSNATNQNYFLSFSLTGFPSIATSAGVYWWVPNLPDGGHMFVGSQTAQIANGTLSSTGGSQSYSPLMDASQGDAGYAVISTPDPSYPSPQSLSSATYLFGPDPLTTTATNTPFTVSGAVQPIVQDQAVPIEVAAPSFTALRPQLPTGSSANLSFLVYSDPYSSTYGVLEEGPPVLTYSGDPTTDWTAGSVPFGNPFPAHALRYCALDEWSSLVSYSPVGFSLYELLSCSSTAPSSGSPVSPAIGPVTSPQIDGVAMDLTTVQTINSTTPTISWSPPAVGTPSYYFVNISSLSPGEPSITFSIHDTQVTVPAGVLVQGETAMVGIDATTNASPDIDAGYFWSPDESATLLITSVTVASTASTTTPAVSRAAVPAPAAAGPGLMKYVRQGLAQVLARHR